MEFINKKFGGVARQNANYTTIQCRDGNAIQYRKHS